MSEKIYRPVILPYWALDEFKLSDILAEVMKKATHVVFTSSDIVDGFSEPISVDDENPEVVYKGIDSSVYEIKCCYVRDDAMLSLKDEPPHYRDLEYRHKKKRF